MNIEKVGNDSVFRPDCWTLVREWWKTPSLSHWGKWKNQHTTEKTTMFVEIYGRLISRDNALVLCKHRFTES